MIPVAKVPVPKGWRQASRQGNTWLKANPPATRTNGPPSKWLPFSRDLAIGFGSRCGYTAAYLDNGHVDHYVPIERLLYRWSNFRYSVGWFNSARQKTPVPDPFVVRTGWFKLSLPDLQLEATNLVPKREEKRVQNALRWLRDDERVMQSRRMYFAMYQAGKLALAGVDELMPLLAEALRADPMYLKIVDGGNAP